jgi:hypothetical protein
MITLYHGSNVDISQIDLTMSKKGKDFGRGFYLNPNRQQAMDMAIRTTKRMGCGNPIVNAYSFDDDAARKDNALNVKVFDGYTTEWAQFILSNRKNSSDIPIHSYDIVVGPIADDTVGLQLWRFLQGYISMERMVEELKYNAQSSMQYYFGSRKALSYLKKESI